MHSCALTESVATDSLYLESIKSNLSIAITIAFSFRLPFAALLPFGLLLYHAAVYPLYFCFLSHDSLLFLDYLSLLSPSLFVFVAAFSDPCLLRHHLWPFVV